MIQKLYKHQKLVPVPHLTVATEPNNTIPNSIALWNKDIFVRACSSVNPFDKKMPKLFIRRVATIYIGTFDAEGKLKEKAKELGIDTTALWKEHKRNILIDALEVSENLAYAGKLVKLHGISSFRKACEGVDLIPEDYKARRVGQIFKYAHFFEKSA